MNKSVLLYATIVVVIVLAAQFTYKSLGITPVWISNLSIGDYMLFVICNIIIWMVGYAFFTWLAKKIIK